MSSVTQPYSVVDLDLETWEQILSGRSYALYYAGWWLRAAAGAMLRLVGCRREADGAVVAVSAFVDRHRRTLTPPYCQHTALLIVADGLSQHDRQELQQTLAEELKRRGHYIALALAPEYPDALGFHWVGYELRTRYNYLWEIGGRSVADLKASMSRSLRRNLSAAQRAGFIFQGQVSPEVALDLFARSASYKSFSGQWDALRRLINEGQRRNAIRLVGLTSPDGEALAIVALIVLHDGIAYLMAEGTDRALAQRYQLKPLLLCQYLEHTNDQPRAIDFEGSMIRPIAKIYQGLGATPQTYLSLTHGHAYHPAVVLSRLLG